MARVSWDEARTLGIAPLGPTQRQPAAVAPAPATVRVLATYLGRAPPLA